MRQWPALTALALSLVAIGLAAAAWFRPSTELKPDAAAEPKPAFTESQIAEAKTSVCTAFKKTDRALDVGAAHRGGDDPIALLANATNIRQVLDFSSRYLLLKLGEQPATPLALADEVRTLASAYQEATMYYLEGLTNTDLDLKPSLHQGDVATLKLREMCK
jgi:hypothetical protein